MTQPSSKPVDRDRPLGVARIVDAHLHMWPDPRPERPYPWTPDPHPIEALLPVLDECGIDRAIQVTPTIMNYDNEYGIQVAERLPERIGVFGRFDVEAPEPAARLDSWMRRTGAEGVRLTFFGPAASARGALTALGPFWSLCEQEQVPVAVLAPGSLAELAEVAHQHPRLRLIVDHLGLGVYPGSPGPYAGWDHLADLAAAPNVATKISTLVETSQEAFPFRDVHDRLAEAVERFGVERLMWASNYPVVLSHCSYRESLEYLGSCRFLDADDLDWITHRAWDRFMGTNPASNSLAGA